MKLGAFYKMNDMMENLNRRLPMTMSTNSNNDGHLRQDKFKNHLFLNIVTTRHEFRLKHVLEKLNAEKFVLLPQVANFLKEKEIDAGLAGKNHNGPDRKTTMRLANEIVDKHYAQKLKLSIVTKKCGAPKIIDVLVRRDVPVTEKLIQEIGEVICN